MAQTNHKKFSTNSRVLSELLTKYRNTFQALGELINNSLQANAKHIDLEIDYANNISSSPIKKICLKDDGHGVAIKDFEQKIFEVGTTSKKDGEGVGRFSALQLGSNVTIETVAWDDSLKKFGKVTLPINSEEFKNRNLTTIDFDVTEEILDKKIAPYYLVRIDNLYHGRQGKIAKKNQISKELLSENIRFALFEKYPYEIFNNEVTFSVNNHPLTKEEFIIEEPVFQKKNYIDIKGDEQEIEFLFFNVNLKINKVKLFLQVENSGIKSVAHEFTYSSDLYSPDLGTWFIYIQSDMFNSDLFKNIDFDELGHEEINKLKNFLKDVINDFFSKRNKRFENFTAQLKAEESYPYKNSVAISETEEILFNKVAFLVEGEFNLIKKESKLKSLIYPLIDAAIKDGNIQGIFDKILKLDKESLGKFHELLEKTELENVIHFANHVAKKTEFLNFLHQIVYGEISNHIKERSQLHKIVENELWLFGEGYNNVPHLWSDRRIGNIFNEIRSQYLVYEPTEQDDNLIHLEDDGLNDITDLFFTNEKILDDGKKEYMIVELKAPKCAISQKELNQIDRYSFTIENKSSLPETDVKYKLILISSKLADFAKSKMASKNYPKPFLYDKKEGKDIEVYVMTWSEIIEMNKRKLAYLSQQLSVKDKSVKDKFETEYAELINAKFRTILKKTK